MSEQSAPNAAPGAMPGLSAEESERMKDAFKDIAERSQKLLQDFADEVQGRRSPARRSAAPHPDLHGLHRQDAGRSQPAAAGADGAVAAVHEPVAGHGPTHDGPEGRARGRARQGRQALQRPGVEGRGRLRLSQAVLSADGALAAAHREGGRGRRRQDREEGRLLYAPVHRRDVALQLRHDQSAGREGDGRIEGREPAEGPAEPADRSRARQGHARHPADRHEGLQGRRQCRHLAGQGRLPEQGDAAPAVRAGDRAGLRRCRC